MPQRQSSVPMLEEIELGCACRVFGERLGVYVQAVQFTTFCMKHVMLARLSPQTKKRSRKLKIAVLVRKAPPGHMVNLFFASTGENLDQAAFKDYFERRQVEELRQKMLQDDPLTEKELFLISKGWFKEDDGTWTAPERLQKRRTEILGRDPSRYQHIGIMHAYNTQNQEDRWARDGVDK